VQNTGPSPILAWKKREQSFAIAPYTKPRSKILRTVSTGISVAMAAQDLSLRQSPLILFFLQNYLLESGFAAS
jgi:hypothetical protein